MSEAKFFEKGKLGREILGEWYQEKGISLEQAEKEKVSESKEKESKEDKEEVSPAEFVFPAPIQKKTDDTKKEEESKKLLVKSKIKRLLAIAEKSGLEKSIREAKKENDPFLLDIYHDVLVKDEAYKKILKK